MGGYCYYSKESVLFELPSDMEPEHLRISVRSRMASQSIDVFSCLFEVIKGSFVLAESKITFMGNQLGFLDQHVERLFKDLRRYFIKHVLSEIDQRAPRRLADSSYRSNEDLDEMEPPGTPRWFKCDYFGGRFLMIQHEDLDDPIKKVDALYPRQAVPKVTTDLGILKAELIKAHQEVADYKKKMDQELATANERVKELEGRSKTLFKAAITDMQAATDSIKQLGDRLEASK